MAQTPNERLLNIAEVAHMLHVSQSTVYRMAEKGELPVIRIGFQFRFLEQEILEFIHNGGSQHGKDK